MRRLSPCSSHSVRVAFAFVTLSFLTADIAYAQRGALIAVSNELGHTITLID
ncbi:MAG: hypothetical protein QOK07_1258, partial [Gemmatimonadaceae bacterium]|nr:hypothetical protein [Gemmatimonadaceae bacterium]